MANAYGGAWGALDILARRLRKEAPPLWEHSPMWPEQFAVVVPAVWYAQLEDTAPSIMYTGPTGPDGILTLRSGLRVLPGGNVSADGRVYTCYMAHLGAIPH